jgi:hypothetical protein
MALRSIALGQLARQPRGNPFHLRTFDLRVVMPGMDEEFEGLDLGDPRRDRRAKELLKRFAAKPTASIPGACDGWSETIAAYRFLSNQEIEWTDVMRPRWQRTAAGAGQFSQKPLEYRLRRAANEASSRSSQAAVDSTGAQWMALQAVVRDEPKRNRCMLAFAYNVIWYAGISGVTAVLRHL